MRAMIFSDLVTMKNGALSLIGIILFIGACCLFGSGSAVAGVAAMAVVLPMMYVMSICAYDEMNGWERFRMTLPLTRAQVVCGRYASTAIVVALGMVLGVVGTYLLVGAGGLLADLGLPFSIPAAPSLEEAVASALLGGGVMLLTAAVGLPPMLRFGLTAGTRAVPVVFIALIAVGIIVLDYTPAYETLEAWGAQLASTSFALLAAALAAVFAAAYLASAGISTRLYAKREL